MRTNSAFLFCVLTACLAGMGGCSPAWEENSAEDQERAREALVTALEAWKSGQVPTLVKRDPPIRFSDDDCRAGLTLTDFVLKAPAIPINPFKDVPVQLTLRDRRGQSQVKLVTYQVGLEPSLTVLRSDN